MFTSIRSTFCRAALFAAFFSLASLASAATAPLPVIVGSWTNTTFGSTGPITGSLDFDAGALTVDVGGGVFGAGDPGPLVLSLVSTTPTSATLEATGDSFFGDVTLNMSGFANSTVDVIATVENIPSIPGGGARIAGYYDTFNMEFHLFYNVTFAEGPTASPSGIEGFDYALGEIYAEVLAPVPLPGGVWLMGSALGLLHWRHRRAGR